MRVPRLTPSEIGRESPRHFARHSRADVYWSLLLDLDAKRKGKSPVFVEQPETVQNGQLMDFQIQGLNFLLKCVWSHFLCFVQTDWGFIDRSHWWVKTGCILADEMVRSVSVFSCV